MTTRSQFDRLGRQLLLCATVALALSGSAFAQSANAGSAKPASATTTEDGGYSAWDITPYVGWQWYQAFQGDNIRNYTSRFNSGWVFGERYNFDYSSKFSVEGLFELGSNRLELKPYTQTGFASFKSTTLEFAIDGVYHFQPRTANTRFFVLAGAAGVLYGGGSTEGPSAIGNFVQPAGPLEKKMEPALVYGVGVKHYFNKHYGVRIDLDGRLNPAAHFGLPSGQEGANTIYIPAKGMNSSLTANIGVILRMHYVERRCPDGSIMPDSGPAGCVTPVSQALRVDIAAAAGSAPTISGVHNVCPGDDLRLSVNANGFANPTYQWQVNGSPAAGATGTSFSVPTASGTGARTITAVVNSTATATSAPYATAGSHTYHLTAEVPNLGGRQASYQWLVNGQPVAGATNASYDLGNEPGKSVSVRVTVAAAPATATANLTINALTPPGLTFAVNPTTVPYGSAPISLSAVPTWSQCGGNGTVRYSGEAVSGSSFNPGGVSGIDMASVLPQRHPVTITATATDAKGQSVSRTAVITVTKDPVAKRLDDVVFQSLSARVNNCGKRLLLEELTPMLRNDPGSKVILIGHRDEKEKGSKAALKLDETRVLNAAAVLSAGKGVCPSLDLSRILEKTAGTDQSSTPRPALCGSSTNVKEKSGQAVKESDKNAQFRRVEVWFVPSGAAMPTTGATPVDSKAVSKLGCPK